jgi:hypothetical protein
MSSSSASAVRVNDDDDDEVHDSMDDYVLKKRRPGCTGMFWRPDPTGQTKLASNDHWPRDNAMLRGTSILVPSSSEKEAPQKWLLVTQVKQQNSDTWMTAPKGAALPFEYDNHYYLEKA